ncbi:hypothetical protein pipiens_016261 [Culex pipiens pipiens]|uniref:Uncharacterized protein n=1 Tax=Culex pipiens pipiens TaxID=38569 RepID=A0ABD1CND3_CULPP
MAPSLRELEKQQSHLRRTLEAIQQFVNAYDATRDADQIDVRLERLDETFNQFRSVRIKIELLTEEDDLDVEVVEVAQLNSAPTNRSDSVPWRPACRPGHPQELDACSTFGCTSKHCNRIRGTAENKLSISSSVHNCA